MDPISLEDVDHVEERLARGVPARTLPSREEREAHELVHLPYKPWCDMCLRAKPKGDPHLAKLPEQQLEDPNLGDQVQLDYTVMDNVKIITMFFVNKKLGSAS